MHLTARTRKNFLKNSYKNPYAGFQLSIHHLHELLLMPNNIFHENFDAALIAFNLFYRPGAILL